MKTFREFLSEQREASPEEVTAKKEFDAKFKTLNRRNVIFNPHSCHQFLDRHKNVNQRRLQYFVDTVSDLDMESKKYYLVFSKSHEVKSISFNWQLEKLLSIILEFLKVFLDNFIL